jgi:hypothetical protein
MLRSWDINPRNRIDFVQMCGLMSNIVLHVKAERRLHMADDVPNAILDRFAELQEHDREVHRRQDVWQRTSSGPYQMLHSPTTFVSAATNTIISSVDPDIQASAGNHDEANEVDHRASGWLLSETDAFMSLAHAHAVARTALVFGDQLSPHLSQQPELAQSSHARGDVPSTFRGLTLEQQMQLVQDAHRVNLVHFERDSSSFLFILVLASMHA